MRGSGGTLLFCKCLIQSSTAYADVVIDNVNIIDIYTVDVATRP